MSIAIDAPGGGAPRGTERLSSSASGASEQNGGDVNITSHRGALATLVVAAAVLPLGVAGAKTSHAGWPKIDGLTVIHHNDETTPMTGTKGKHNELLGGHGDDTIVAGNIGDVLWGDYKPCCQPATQTDTIRGGAGKDFIYASHGRNIIFTGGGADVVHAHFGRGEIHCGSAQAIVYISHKSRPHYTLVGCKRVSYKTLGY
jgi:Ca2+-binding RTX toxin-like protein